MDVIIFLIPMALILGVIGIAVFFWALRSGQYDDPEGDSQRILLDDDKDIRIN